MKGFGGKFGVQTDRQDKCALGWDHQEKSQLHESQKGGCRAWLVSTQATLLLRRVRAVFLWQCGLSSLLGCPFCPHSSEKTATK